MNYACEHCNAAALLINACSEVQFYFSFKKALRLFITALANCALLVTRFPSKGECEDEWGYVPEDALSSFKCPIKLELKDYEGPH